MSFTYNDHVLHERDPKNSIYAMWEWPYPMARYRRRVLTRVNMPVNIDVLVSRTTHTPEPGSDEINRAYEEGWVGNDRLAFIGDTVSVRR